jgi:peptidoglycan/xylan/chitin deacetylase (PgdA/CDA1 family)
VLAAVHRLGYGGIRWTVDTLGWEGRSAGQSVDTVVARAVGAASPGEIVLMHVGSAQDASTLDADALPRVIADLRARGYRFASVAEFIGL